MHQNPAVKFRCKEGAAGRHGPQRVGEGGQRYTRPNPAEQRLERGDEQGFTTTVILTRGGNVTRAQTLRWDPYGRGGQQSVATFVFVARGGGVTHAHALG